jgi:hypothetical protein
VVRTRRGAPRRSAHRAHSLSRLLEELEASARSFGPGRAALTERLLARIGRRRFEDAVSLVRFHEIALFLRAYPQSAGVRRLADEALAAFESRVEKLRAGGADLSAFDPAEVSGVAGTSISTPGYDVLRRLARRYPRRLTLDWEGYEGANRLAATWPRFFPLLEEDSLVEAEVPYPVWLAAARGRSGRDLAWLLRRFESLPIPETERAELFDSLELPASWELGGSPASRTAMRRLPRRVFYHRTPLIRRSEVDLKQALFAPRPPLRRLSTTEGTRILDLARESSAVRYRELYGFTHGDPARVLRADVGRGVEISLSGLPPERRLPLRAYHAALVVKNGVPVGYAEGLSLFERMELGYNVYYTFRAGESAWILGQLLGLFRRMLGVTAFSVDPYQLGYRNEEAIESGAFWFYRKLGFRPARRDLVHLIEAEEARMASRPGYRSPPRVLRRLARGHLIFDGTGASGGDWDRFLARNVGLAVQRRMATRFGGDAGGIRRASSAAAARALDADLAAWSRAERAAFAEWALALAPIPDLARWSKAEREGVIRIVRAKAAADESRYLRALRAHPRLRAAILALGRA